LLPRHAWQLYRLDVVAGSKARIAGYSAVQAYITAVWAYYEWGQRGRKVGKEGKGMGKKMVATNGDGKVHCRKVAIEESGVSKSSRHGAKRRCGL